MKTCTILFVLPLLILSACSTPINFDHEDVSFMGRTGITKDSSAAELFWSGASVSINFIGRRVNAVLQDAGGENYYNVLIDDSLSFILRPDTVKRSYTLASGLSRGKHRVELFRRTESYRGKTLFYRFELKGMSRLLPANKPKEKMIEFYGNSITCGFGNEDYSGNDSPDSIYTNNYLSYAAITARYFDAEYSCISRSGIGIMVSWFNQIMPELYYRLDESDSLSVWDFSIRQPEIVVVNLLQNDSWIVNHPDNIEYQRRFGENRPTSTEYETAYATFIKQIRGHYPKASIICLLGNMDITREGSEWPALVKRSVESIDDENVLTSFVPFKNTKGHPKVEEQQVIADSLILFIEKNIGW